MAAVCETDLLAVNLISGLCHCGHVWVIKNMKGSQEIQVIMNTGNIKEYHFQGSC